MSIYKDILYFVLYNLFCFVYNREEHIYSVEGGNFMLTHAELGAKLKEARSISGLKQQEAAENLNIGRQKLISIEKGMGPIDTVLLKKMADLYGFALDHFFEEDNEEFDVKLAFRAADLEEDDQQTINWSRKVLVNIGILNEICEELN
ncbi:XRE family transcriptional regulator [Bacillus velezensis]|nr:XRE family transcriptional regulator [Bacillus velezensis]